jgi:PAS domain S-box-containing protein
MREQAGSWKAARAMPSRRVSVLVAAALLFAGVSMIGIVDPSVDDLVSVLYALPVALIAVELGLAWGITAAVLALGLFGFWNATDHTFNGNLVDYASLGATFLVLGGAVGALADHLRRISAESDRFWGLSTELLCAVGFDGYFKRLSGAWEQTLGWTPQELCSKPFIEFIHPDDREVTRSEEGALRNADHVTHNLENRYLCKDGSYRSLLWGARSIPAEQLTYASARDLTERKLVEQKAEAARSEAERANRAKSEFLSRMSHELRTPLNAVIGFAQLLELDDLAANQSEGVEQILKAGRHLLALINEVLDISRIESGTMSLSLEPVHLGNALAEALSLIRPLATEAEVSLRTDHTELAELHALADHQRLKQVLINVLSNAVKYNRRGGEIHVSCTQRPNARIEIAVADTGHGIAEGKLQRLFDPFDRLDAERTGIEGTGLGLALSLRLMEAMGGTITAESELETGTTMRVELDRGQEPEDYAVTRSEALSGASRALSGTVIYIEDNLSNVKLVERVIERFPEVRLIPAMQGRLGIDLARQHQPDLILLDLHLPDLQGRDVLQQLKDDPTTAAIPVVILSADATTAQVQRLKAAGAAEYMTKPIDIELLIKTLTGTLSAHATKLKHSPHSQIA